MIHALIFLSVALAGVANPLMFSVICGNGLRTETGKRYVFTDLQRGMAG